MTSRLPLVVVCLSSLLAGAAALLGCAGDDAERGKSTGVVGFAGSAGSAGSGSLGFGGRGGGPTAGAAGSAPVVEPTDCDCVPVAPSAEEGPGYFVMGEPRDACTADEQPFYRQPNPAKCTAATCTSTHVSYDESSCVGGTSVPGELQSGVDDFGTCRPLSLPTRGSAFFGSALVYWTCGPGEPGPAFDQRFCARHFAAPAAAACPAKTFCVPRGAGSVCVRGTGPPPAGWVKGTYDNPSRCIGASGELTSPMEVTLFNQVGCKGESKLVSAETCATFAGGEPRSYVIEEPIAQKTPALVEFLEDVADLYCRP